MTFDSSNLGYLEEMYLQYLINPSKIEMPLRHYFQNFEPHSPVDQEKAVDLDCRIGNLINGYRAYGHLMAKINPLSADNLPEPWQLTLQAYGLKKEDLSKVVSTQGVLKEQEAALEKILDGLKRTYCDKIGVEFKDLFDPEVEKWIQEQIEPCAFHFPLTIDQKRTILQHLNKSELFEAFLHTKYPGQKRFSLEGGETIIPILQAIIDTGATHDGKEFIIGMAHRGRLNVLSNILKKSYIEIFSEFNENFIPESFEGSGDVKYHKGFYSEGLTVQGHRINVALTPNPSHLEAVDAVVEGQTKALQILKSDPKSQDQVVPILVHGDAAISGQGVVYETLQLSKLKGYATGGTLHVIINNQIGFTTVPEEGRSTRYCTDIAKAFGAPVFHVNAEDPEGCFNVGILAMQLRQKFGCDVFIDVNCYRKYGHNEADEPAFTQPLEYKIIREKKSIREIYRDDLIQQGVLEKQMAEALEVEFKKDLQAALSETKAKFEKAVPKKEPEDFLPGNKEENLYQYVDTAVSRSTLQEVAEKFCTIPPGYHIHPKLEGLIKERLNMVSSGPEVKPLDWGMAETLAYATLLWEGKHVRITGQDSGRGTFSHRHGLWVDQNDEKYYFPLQHLKQDQGRFDLINSPLSEYAALAFEYGYSITYPQALIIWEAQFGDFCNGAQVVIDQFIASAQQKWGQTSGLTLFLPHGYEGQGPEHSSGRMERFLSLAGNDNFYIVNPSTPAQLFHLLRRQVMRRVQKPLIVFTPKGLLRHPDCTSPLVDLSQGSFQEVLDDPQSSKQAERVVFCTGRIYYDLRMMRSKTETEDLILIRLEQLYPLHLEKIRAILKNYPHLKEFIWAQEEPKNMGAWNFVAPLLSELLPSDQKLRYVGRARSASPAAGSYALHKKEHAAIMDAIFIQKKPSIFELARNPKK